MFHPELVLALAEGVHFEPGLFSHSEHTAGSYCAHARNQHLRRPDSEYTEAYPYDLRFCPECRKDISKFAARLLTSATACLPETMPWMKGDERADISLRAIVNKWIHGSKWTRLEIGRELVSVLCPEKRADGSPFKNRNGEDSYDQPRERVLPRLYGQWDVKKGADNRPNCLGKFQLLVAFGELCQAKMLATSPLIYSSDILQISREVACKHVLECYHECGFILGLKRFESLCRIMNHRELQEGLPKLVHSSVLYKIGKGCWMLVDPNWGIASIMENGRELDSLYDKLEAVSQSAPGASILLESISPQMSWLFVESLKLSCSNIKKIHTQIHEAKNWNMLRALFVKYGIAGEIASWDIGMSFEEMAILLWSKGNLDCLRRAGALSSLNEEDFEELKDTLIYQYLMRFEREMLGSYQMGVLKGEISHPLSEVSLPHFRLGIDTLSHVAQDLGPEIAGQTEGILFPFGLAEARLYNVLCSGGYGFNGHAERARLILENQESHGKLAHSFFVLEGESEGD